MAAVSFPRVLEFDRADFLASRFDHRPGEHVTVLGPTGAGKSQLITGMLDAVADPRAPSITMGMKPKDVTLTAWARASGQRTVRDWPPMWSPIYNNEPPGWIVWPKHTMEADADTARHAAIFSKVCAWAYKRAAKHPGGLKLNVDEFRAGKRLGLNGWFDHIHELGRALGLSEWGSAQGPRHISMNALSMPEHIAILNDPDEYQQDRYGEIGGFNPRHIKEIVRSLPDYHALYIRRRGRVMCIVLP